MRVLVTGCNGQLGQKLIQTADSVQIFGLDKRLSDPFLQNNRFYALDLLDKDALAERIQSIQPDWILNAAAYTGVDAAEEEKNLCWQQNVVAVENLIYAARKQNSRLLHVSTDYIFDGKAGPYGETDPPNPLGYYGRSKLASENVLKASSLHIAIVRTMILYGTNRAGQQNFVTWLINALKRGNAVKIVTDQIGNTTLSDDLARGIWTIVEREKSGIYHIAGSEIVSRYDFAKTIAGVFGLDGDLIQPITTGELEQKAPRPLNSGLRIEKAMQELEIAPKDVKTGLECFKKQLEDLAAMFA
ncbi:dTDP-4-dehydrorhamnose reductase [candidate division KSB1 bacterium]|nr:dTDP-4-dehydrorhamnose reductase [candidate division KSB1 bacterium]